MAYGRPCRVTGEGVWAIPPRAEAIRRYSMRFTAQVIVVVEQVPLQQSVFVAQVAPTGLQTATGGTQIFLAGSQLALVQSDEVVHGPPSGTLVDAHFRVPSAWGRHFVPQHSSVKRQGMASGMHAIGSE